MTNQEDREVAETFHYLDSNFLRNKEKKCFLHFYENFLVVNKAIYIKLL